MSALEALASEARWVIWRFEQRGNRVTKIPYSADGKKAKADNPSTWCSRGEAEEAAAQIINGLGGGVGIELGDPGNDLFLGGVDLDSCVDVEKNCLAGWADEILNAMPTYAEVSPSGKGVKAFFFCAAEYARRFLDTIGVDPDKWGTKRGIAGHNGADHGPGVEVYLSHRFFAVTKQLVSGQPDRIATLDWEALQQLARLIPKARRGGNGRIGPDTSRSGKAFRECARLQREGKTFEQVVDALLADPKTAEWVRTKGYANGGRELRRMWENTDPPEPTGTPGELNWRAGLIVNKHNEPLALEANGMTALRGHPEMLGLFGTDEFTQRANLMRRPPWGRSGEQFPRPVHDADLSELLAWLQAQGIHLHGRAPVRIILASITRERMFHPVRDYLRGLKWDKKPRLDTWLTYYLGVEPIENYTAMVGRMWTISAVARIFQPGCIAKYVLVIEGPQDLGKSTALRILGTPWFTDDIATLGSKDSQMQVGNAWIIELAELDSTRRADITATKAFISRAVDQFRPPYGEHIVRQERQSILAATVNPAGAYLHDETGAVRFWPVVATSIDLDTLRNDRDQLWAEAVARYQAGEHWWPNDEFKATEQQEARSETPVSDPWFDIVEDWMRRQVKETFKADEILADVLQIPRERMDRRAERRLGGILRHLGYVSGGVRIGDGTAVRRWRRKLSTTD